MHFSEEPLCAVVHTNRLSTSCSRCFSKCKTVHYCGSECQLKDWLQHRLECRCLGQCPETSDGKRRVPPAVVRLMQRLLVAEQETTSGGTSGAGAGQRTFADLKDHVAELKARLDKMEEFTVNTRVLVEYVGEQVSLPDAAGLLRVFGKICVNAVHIQDDDLRRVGVGIYLELSSIDHSCEPNAFVVFDGRRACLRSAAQSVQTLADARISYVDVLAARDRRRNDLLDNYLFKCDCARCADQLDDDRIRPFLCASCHHILPPAPHQQNCVRCDKCGVETSRDESVKIMQEIDWFLYQMNEQFNSASKADNPFYSWEAAVDKCDELWRRAERLLPTDRNGHAMLLAECACDAALKGLTDSVYAPGAVAADQPFDECEYKLPLAADVWLQRVAVCARNLYKASDPSLTLSCLRAAKAAYFVADRNDHEAVKRAVDWYTAARDNGRLSHGEEHPVYKAILQSLAQCRLNLKQIS